MEEDHEKRNMTIDHSENDIKQLKNAGIANNFNVKDVKNTTVPDMAKSQFQYGISIQQSKALGNRNDAKSQQYTASPINANASKMFDKRHPYSGLRQNDKV